jgi:hypothetical protein
VRAPLTMAMSVGFNMEILPAEEFRARQPNSSV